MIGDDATFSSGAKVTAEDVAFSLQRAIKMNRAAFIIGQFGFTPWNAETTIVAADEKTVKLTTAKLMIRSALLPLREYRRDR